MKAYDKLNPEQKSAVDSMLEFMKGEDKLFVLSGSAGVGKTFSLKAFAEKVRGRIIFTAPTNKATKVLRDTLTDDGYKPECRTIYSLLGLRLEPNGEVRELAIPDDPVDLTQYVAIIIDEASMINQVLMEYLQGVIGAYPIKVIFMGDRAQLPPVGERESKVWSITAQANLTKVMRFGNQILPFVTKIRNVVDHPSPSIEIVSDNKDGEGVWRLGPVEFERRLLEAADNREFSDGKRAKAIAWRNATVDTLNRLIRGRIFDNPATPWLPEDRIILLEPAKNLEGDTIATTDDEGVITKAEEGYHPLYPAFKIWNLSVTLDDNRTISLRVLHGESMAAYTSQLTTLAEEARANKRKWPKFWEFKEAFHNVRHGYAITAHRAQGSTYESVFVDWRDILANRNRQEAFRCLYVACSRPKKRLFLA